MKIGLIACHDAESTRKIDFHFWADVLERQGHDVCFLTVGYSLISKWKKDPRCPLPPYNQWKQVRPHLKKFSWLPLFHPIVKPLGNIPVLNKIFDLYPALLPKAAVKEFQGADIVIIESGAGLMLVPKLKTALPDTRFIYTVSDRLKTVGAHPAVIRGEETALPLCDLIRVPADVMRKDFASFPDLSGRIAFVPPGISKDVMDIDCENPYKNAKNVVSVGAMLFDPWMIRTLAESFPDWTFHLFGHAARLGTQHQNVIEYGERPFAEIVPFIKYADIGLAPYRNGKNAEYLCQSSLKLTQYTYAGLPIVAPDFAAAGRNNICAYQPENEQELINAFEKAQTFDRSQINSSGIMGWDEVLEQIIMKVA
ncbi:MAG: hypothetical protein RBR86_03975 [Pseudobdellovibrionaceae bacterium]|jgi:2-beta-glucuronyltransferase|nr:hypothetical protein [Pseudobdellovibrionaceae bacterium]